MGKFSTNPKSVELLPEGDYVVEVVAAETGIQAGTGKTRGSDYTEIELRVVGNEGQSDGRCWDRLIKHEACEGHINRFMVATDWHKLDGTGPKESDDMTDLCKQLVPATVIGLRGWAHIIIDTPPARATKPGEAPQESRPRNKVKYYRTDKPRLTRIEQDQPADDPFAT